MPLPFNLQRAFNLLNHRAPTKAVSVLANLASRDANALPDSIVKCHQVEPPVSSYLNFSNVYPLTSEDYILDVDKDKNSNVEFASRFQFEIHNCRMLPTHGDVITSDRELLFEFSPRNWSGDTHAALLRKRYPKTKRLSGLSLSLVVPFSTNYFHWMCDAFPMLEHVSSFITEIDHFIVRKRSSYVVSSLTKLGVCEEKIVELDQFELHCEKLLVHNIEPTMHVYPKVSEWLRKSLGVTPLESKSRRKLYITRDDAPERRVTNEHQVRDFLGHLGYETLCLSDLDLTAQVDAFSNASHIISVHGAGLTNMVFASPTAKVLEIFPSCWSPVCYLSLSAQIGLQHYFCSSDPFGIGIEKVAEYRSSIPQSNAQHIRDLQIPLDKLQAFCDL